jgi:titin
LTFTTTDVQAGSTYKFTVQARNAAGFGITSAEFSITAASLPGIPTAVTRDEALTSQTQVSFTWSAPSSNGGSPVIDYTIYWDQGSGVFV